MNRTGIFILTLIITGLSSLNSSKSMAQTQGITYFSHDSPVANDALTGTISSNRGETTDISLPYAADAEQKNTASTKQGEKSYVLKKLTELAVYPVFEKYKRNKNSSLTVMENADRGIFMTLDLYSPELVNEIESLLEKDMKKAANITRTYSETEDDILVSINHIYNGTLTIHFSTNLKKNRGNLWISAPDGL